MLDLGFNLLNGTIPNSLKGLSSLSSLYLNNNQLTGSIPADLENYLLIILDISFNQLTGEIPSSLGTIIERDSAQRAKKGSQNLTSVSIILLERFRRRLEIS
jgi:Leucine-rich repeat (LRR) protein